MGFKEDADFARFVSMGAVGTATVGIDLRTRFGHRPIELERYAMANKVWQTKVKRLRLPDLVCVRCGLRVESRAKSRLGIVVSDSDTAGREWDAGGMRDHDLYAFLRADLARFPPSAGTPTYFATAALRAAVGHAKRSSPKAASEGSEVTLTWPSFVPSKTGRFTGIDAEGRLVLTWDGGGTLRYWQWRRWAEPRFTYVEPGGPVAGDETIVAGVVEPVVAIDCPGEHWDLVSALDSEDDTERYASIKAAGVLARSDLGPAILRIADDDADWRIRLEAFATLARLEPNSWTDRVLAVAIGADGTLEHQMEAVFILSEIPTPDAGAALAAVASAVELPVELRAAAAWGLGQGVARRPELLIPLTLDQETFVALHAITAIEKLPDELSPTLIGWMSEPDDHRSAIAACLLGRHRRVGALLDACQQDARSRSWALRALGDLPPPLVRLLAGDRLTPDLVELLMPMWRGQDDWLRTEGKEGLDALDIQKVRFDPANPG